jgi:hypothetical protein
MKYAADMGLGAMIYMPGFMKTDSAKEKLIQEATQRAWGSHKPIFLKFEVFTEVNMKNAVFWDVAPCRSCVNRRFGGTSVHAKSIWRHIPEDGIFQAYFLF